MNKSNKINVNASSLVDLKAELFKKQEQLKKDNLLPQGSSRSCNKNKDSELNFRKSSIWTKKNAGVKARAEKDLEQIAEERSELENARSKLEAKAKFYEQMTKKGYLPESDTEGMFLVDFEKKALDQLEESRSKVVGPPSQQENRDGVDKEECEKRPREDVADIPPPANEDEEWVDYTDTLGRSRRCMRKDLSHLIAMDKRLNPQVFEEKERKAEKEKKDELPDLLSNDMYREMLRKKWEQEEEEAAKGPQGPTHYQNIKYDEVRDMGVGYFDFSKDQSKRNEQMETLQLLRDETMDQRQRREKMKQKRKAAMQARLAKVKERKRQRGDFVEDENEAEANEEMEGRELKPVSPEQSGLTDSVESSSEQKTTHVREWDIGKEPVSPWDQRISNIRDERPAEFAPPSTYTNPNQRRAHLQRPSYQPAKDYSSLYGNSTEKTGGKSSYLNRNKSTDPSQSTAFSAGRVSNFSINEEMGNVTNSYGIEGTTPLARTSESGAHGHLGLSSKDEESISAALSFYRQTSEK